MLLRTRRRRPCDPEGGHVALGARPKERKRRYTRLHESVSRLPRGTGGAPCPLVEVAERRCGHLAGAGCTGSPPPTSSPGRHVSFPVSCTQALVPLGSWHGLWAHLHTFRALLSPGPLGSGRRAGREAGTARPPWASGLAFADWWAAGPRCPGVPHPGHTHSVWRLFSPGL